MNKRWKTSYYKQHIKGVTFNKLPILFASDSNVLYEGLEKNGHHYTTWYHRTYVMPLLASVLNFEYDRKDFRLVKYVKKGFDFSYLKPKKEYRYQVTHFPTNETNEYSYEDLCSESVEANTIYHTLYKFNHSVSRIVNLDSKSDRILFISGDSQMVPSIMPLTHYFKEVWYFDNRTGKIYDNEKEKFCMDKEKMEHFSIHFKDVQFTDVLVELYTNPYHWYTQINLA